MIGKLETLNHRLYPQKVFHAPKWLVLGVNNICNLHCKMCDVGLKVNDTNFATNLTGTKPNNMPLELIKRVIDQSALHYPTVKLGYASTEPLIYPHLIESIAYATEKNLFTAITTNALTLKHKAAGLVDAGLGELFVSLDGPETIHNYIRGHKNSYGRALDGIQEIISLKPGIKVSVFCVITEWNIGHLGEFLEALRHLPLQQVGLMHTSFVTRDLADAHNQILHADYSATYSNTDEIDLSKMDLDTLAKEVLEIKNSEYPFKVTFSPELSSKEEINVFYHKPELKLGKLCSDVFRNVMIKSNGTVIPAHGRCYNLTIGNLYEESLKEIWNSSIISQFRKKLIQHDGLFPACTRCCSAY
ncbi:MAG: radical SAM protein [Bacteroidota bacterium]